MSAQPEVFRPARTQGGAIVAGGALAGLAVTIGIVLAAREAVDDPAVLVPPVMIVTLVLAPLAALAISSRFMRYELDDEALHLRCPPFLHYRIPLGRIRSIERGDLEPTMWSALRLPGLALFTVPYSDAGPVKMCATRASQDIVLVDTDDGRYGMTPADPRALTRAIEARVSTAG